MGEIAGDMMKLLTAVGLPAELGGELADCRVQARPRQLATGNVRHQVGDAYPAELHTEVLQVLLDHGHSAFLACGRLRLRTGRPIGGRESPGRSEMLATPDSWKILAATDPLKVTPAKPTAETAKPNLLAEMVTKEAANAKLLAEMANEAPF